MTKVFLRYFFTMFIISILVMGIPFLALTLQYDISADRWQTQVYVDFVDNISQIMSSGRFSDYGIGSIYQAMSEIDDARVCGFVIRDPSGTNVFTFGKNPDGRMLSSMFTSGPRKGEMTMTEIKTPNWTEIDIETSYGRVSGVTVNATGKKVSITVPVYLKSEKAIGSILVSIDGTQAFIIDLLVYTPRTYEYSKDLVNSCIRGIVLSVLFSLFFALISAWIVSSRNAEYINNVRKALKDLAKGKPDVSLPDQSNSELGEINTAIEELGRNLQANARSRKAWLSSISHDLNTPAAAIKMMVEGMNDGVFTADADTLSSLMAESNTLTDRIGRVIDFATLQADTTPELEEVSVQALISELEASFRNSDKVDFKALCETVRCDAVLMTRALNELLSNAIKAQGEASEPVRFELGETEDSYEVRISNKGSLPSNMDVDFFEPWARGDWSRTSGEGSGLGLPIATTILFLHKGTVALEQVDENTVLATVKWPKIK